MFKSFQTKFSPALRSTLKKDPERIKHSDFQTALMFLGDVVRLCTQGAVTLEQIPLYLLGMAPYLQGEHGFLEAFQKAQYIELKLMPLSTECVEGYLTLIPYRRKSKKRKKTVKQRLGGLQLYFVRNGNVRCASHTIV